ncbi:hypothetical protein KP509_20G009700 [Ceratopteris richardii]|nr:hypothetical protein KP509_20G009700 [Ceratopteris richardii]
MLAKPTGRHVVPLLDGDAAPCTHSSQDHSHFPFVNERINLPEEKVVDSGPFLIPHMNELSSDGVGCHTLKLVDHRSSREQFAKFEVHLSNLCQKGFVMFDHSGSERRMIFHPSILDDIPALQQSSTGHSERAVNAKHLQDVLVNHPLLGDCVPPGNMIFPDRRSASLLSREHICLAAYGADTGSHSEEATDFLSKENTEDLNALLWSDDEMSSTGDSPSDLLLSDADSSDVINSEWGYDTCSGRKRKVCTEIENENMVASDSAVLKRAFCTARQCLDRGSGYGKEAFTVFDLSSDDYESSSASSTTKRWKQVQSAPPRKLVNITTRKEKIQSAFQLLRSILPGGQSMDSAVILSEVVQYVKNLQSEIEKLRE